MAERKAKLKGERRKLKAKLKAARETLQTSGNNLERYPDDDHFKEQVQQARDKVTELGEQLKCLTFSDEPTPPTSSDPPHPLPSATPGYDICLWIKMCERKYGMLLPFEAAYLGNLWFSVFPEMVPIKQGLPQLDPFKLAFIWELCRTWKTMSEAGFVHQDLRLANICFNQVSRRLIFIDLDRVAEKHHIYKRVYSKDWVQYDHGSSWTYERQDLLQVGLLGIQLLTNNPITSTRDLENETKTCLDILKETAKRGGQRGKKIMALVDIFLEWVSTNDSDKKPSVDQILDNKSLKPSDDEVELLWKALEHQ
jgi:hypothetical protein